MLSSYLIVKLCSNIPTDAVQCASVSDKAKAVRDQYYFMARVILLDLLDGHYIFMDSKPRHKDTIFHLKEIQVCPGLFGRPGHIIVQFLHIETFGFKCLLQSISEAFIQVDVIVHENIVVTYGPDHPVGVAKDFVPVPRDDSDLAFKSLFQALPKTFGGIAGILPENLFGHNYALTALDYIAPINDNPGLLAFEV